MTDEQKYNNRNIKIIKNNIEKIWLMSKNIDIKIIKSNIKKT